MGKEIADEAVRVPLVHGEGRVCARAEDTWGERLGERGYILFRCGGKLNEAGKMGSYGVEGGDVGEAKLAEGVLQDRNAGFRGGRGIGG